MDAPKDHPSLKEIVEFVEKHKGKEEQIEKKIEMKDNKINLVIQ